MTERAWLGKVPECGAPTKQGDGSPCKLPAGAGTDHKGVGKCKLHFGATPSHGVAAVREVAARASAPQWVDPAQALLSEVHRSAGVVAYIEQQVQWLSGNEMLVTKTSVSPWMIEYRNERAHLAKVAATALQAGVAERHVRLAEQQGQLVAVAIQNVLGELDLSPQQRSVAPALIRRHLMSLASPVALAPVPDSDEDDGDLEADR